jgi:hypothetical protein
VVVDDESRLDVADDRLPLVRRQSRVQRDRDDATARRPEDDADVVGRARHAQHDAVAHAQAALVQCSGDPSLGALALGGGEDVGHPKPSTS